jgi:hypothetical protein
MLIYVHTHTYWSGMDEKEWEKLTPSMAKIRDLQE